MFSQASVCPTLGGGGGGWGRWVTMDQVTTPPPRNMDMGPGHNTPSPPPGTWSQHLPPPLHLRHGHNTPLPPPWNMDMGPGHNTPLPTWDMVTTPAPPPPGLCTGGLYASYWNAFLLYGAFRTQSYQSIFLENQIPRKDFMYPKVSSLSLPPFPWIKNSPTCVFRLFGTNRGQNFLQSSS